MQKNETSSCGNRTDELNENGSSKSEIIKTMFVAMIVFFGTSFAIMSFNEDVGVGDLFEKMYLMMNGRKHSGLGVLEMSYGIGMALGITLFYNRLTNKKNRQNEPTPIEIKMKQYEDDINDYIKYKSQSRS
ncbi:MAG: hypothetical protein II919_06825 [Lachnospiraceae bacterium]|nr:hypothetical protein [Lachnospiraceae bacterium]